MKFISLVFVLLLIPIGMAYGGQVNPDIEYECNFESSQEEINDYAREIYLLNTGISLYLEHMHLYEHTGIEDMTQQFLSNPELIVEIGDRATCLKEVHHIEPDSVAMFNQNVQELISNNYEEVALISPNLVKYVTVPEFGSIAMLILVISIIVVTTFTRKGTLIK